jgi:hypothetical protein
MGHQKLAANFVLADYIKLVFHFISLNPLNFLLELVGLALFNHFIDQKSAFNKLRANFSQVTNFY